MSISTDSLRAVGAGGDSLSERASGFSRSSGLGLPLVARVVVVVWIPASSCAVLMTDAGP